MPHIATQLLDSPSPHRQVERRLAYTRRLLEKNYAAERQSGFLLDHAVWILTLEIYLMTSMGGSSKVRDIGHTLRQSRATTLRFVLALEKRGIVEFREDPAKRLSVVLTNRARSQMSDALDQLLERCPGRC